VAPQLPQLLLVESYLLKYLRVIHPSLGTLYHRPIGPHHALLRPILAQLPVSPALRRFLLRLRPGLTPLYKLDMTPALHALSMGHNHSTFQVGGASPATEAATKLLRVLLLAEQPRLLRVLFLNLDDVVEFLCLVHEFGREVESRVLEEMLVVLRSPLD
jgi:hypothetical protein